MAQEKYIIAEGKKIEHGGRLVSAEEIHKLPKKIIELLLNKKIISTTK